MMMREKSDNVGPPPTLGRLVANRQDLTPWCESCGRLGATLRAEDLVARFGPDMLALHVARHLKCAKCGSKNVTTRVSVRNAPFSPGYSLPDTGL